jgi:hypothetical protein
MPNRFHRTLRQASKRQQPLRQASRVSSCGLISLIYGTTDGTEREKP